VTGSQGFTGPQGSTGIGLTGVQGPTGVLGPVGGKGATGPTPTFSENQSFSLSLSTINYTLTQNTIIALSNINILPRSTIITTGEGNLNFYNNDYIPNLVRITAIGRGGNGGIGGGSLIGGGGGGGGGRVIYTTLANNYDISYKIFSNVSVDNYASVVKLSNIYTSDVLDLIAYDGKYGLADGSGGDGGTASGPPGSITSPGGNGLSEFESTGGRGGGFGGSQELGGYGSNGFLTGERGPRSGDGGGGGGGGLSGEQGGGTGGEGGDPRITFEWL
jgi:hypothetical protein